MQNVRICGRVPPVIRYKFCQPIIVGTVRLQTDYRRHVSAYLAFASLNLIELDRDIISECNDMFPD